MPKKSRRRRGRSRGDKRPPPSPPPAKPAEAAPGVSWTGLVGGLLGLGPTAGLGIEFLVDPPDEGPALAAVPLAMSVVYLPAVWASVSATRRRRAVLRGVVAASIFMVFVSLPFLGPTLAVALIPATALLAVAAGLLFGR